MVGLRVMCSRSLMTRGWSDLTRTLLGKLATRWLRSRLTLAFKMRDARLDHAAKPC